MLGPSRHRDLDRPVIVSLEQLVPAEHFYRHLDAQLDLSFVRDWVKECYAPIGRPSIDPIVFFKLQLVMFFEGLRSERQLVEIAGLNLAHRWYLRYDLDESMPDHSSLTRIRKRLGVDIFRRFCEQVVDLCNQAGLIWGQELLMDATKVRASASMDSLVSRLAEVVDDHLVELFGDLEEPAETTPGNEEADEPPLLFAEGLAGAQADHPNQERRWDVLQECRLDPERPLSPGYARLSSRKVSRTDQDHYLVECGTAWIILHALITSGDVMENQPFRAQPGGPSSAISFVPSVSSPIPLMARSRIFWRSRRMASRPSSPCRTGRSPHRTTALTGSRTTLSGMSTSARRTRS